jgi:hypothetical protein
MKDVALKKQRLKKYREGLKSITTVLRQNTSLPWQVVSSGLRDQQA